jgi:hypothetical protein
VSAWDPGQVRFFAKQIAESQEGRAWWAFPPTIRNAIISHHVLMLLFSQRGQETCCVDDFREVRIAIEERLAKHHNLKVLG